MRSQRAAKPNASENATTIDEPCRLDLWLYHARFFKTRSLATKAILKGKIRITRHGRTERTKKAHLLLRPGDQVIFMRGSKLIHIEMIMASKRRGPAPEARGLYHIIEETA